MPNLTNAEDLAREWIDSWNNGRPDDIPLSDDFVHTSPFGTVSGREKYLAWVKPLAAQNVTRLKVLRTLGGDREAAIWFEMTTPQGPVRVCDWVETRGAHITAVTSFYDASSLRATTPDYQT